MIILILLLRKDLFLFMKDWAVSKKIMNRFEASSSEVALDKLKVYLNDLKKADIEASQITSINLSLDKLIDKNKERLFIGYLYPKSILKSLGIKSICDDISDKLQFKFELDDILCDLVSSRILNDHHIKMTLILSNLLNMNYMMHTGHFLYWLKKIPY